MNLRNSKAGGGAEEASRSKAQNWRRRKRRVYISKVSEKNLKIKPKQCVKKSQALQAG